MPYLVGGLKIGFGLGISYAGSVFIAGVLNDWFDSNAWNDNDDWND